MSLSTNTIIMGLYVVSSSDVVLFQPPRVQNKVEESRIRYPGTADSKELEKWIRATLYEAHSCV